jgi:SAM-dependent MidA family methyltransferase
MNAPLPQPDEDARAASTELVRLIEGEIAAAGGWLPFVRYMELALHAPGLGYYGGGSRKFGIEGDFLTAPELTPLFGQALAAQVAQVAAASAPQVLEVGAGTGRLAVDLLRALDVERYFILELSGELRARQQQLIAEEVPDRQGRVVWLDALPDEFSGCVVANELLDAMPVHAVAWRKEGLMERGIVSGDDGLAWAERPADTALAAAMAALPVAAPFESEIGLVATHWIAEWGHRLHAGALLLIDYGLPRHEYYHAARARGTLRCHYRQRSHDDPLWWPGLSDITAHVDFTAMAEAGHAAGLDVLGYTNQASFLINCGLGDLLAARQGDEGLGGRRAAGAVQVLISMNEMGELFKVLALGRGITTPLRGFALGDRRHAL